MIRVVVDDLASMQVDAVVRPATALLERATASPARLEQVGAPLFRQQAPLEHPLDIGAAVVTAAATALGAEFVIHAVVESAERPVSREGVRRALVSVLQRARDWELARIATPLLGVGEGDLTLEDGVQVMLDVLVTEGRHVPFPTEVYIVVERDEDRALVDAYLKSRLAHES